MYIIFRGYFHSTRQTRAFIVKTEPRTKKDLVCTTRATVNAKIRALAQTQNARFGNHAAISHSISLLPLAGKLWNFFSSSIYFNFPRSRSNSLKKANSFRSLKRKRSLIDLMSSRSPEEIANKHSRTDEDSGIGQGRTGLTQEIQLMELSKSAVEETEPLPPVPTSPRNEK